MKFSFYALAFFMTVVLCLMSSSTIAADRALPDATAALQASFVAKGQASIDRLQQDKTQVLCTAHARTSLPAAVAQQISALSLATIKPPSNGQYLGDFTRGETIALNGSGLQYNDDPAKPVGGNCYACHEMAASELAYGTLGPSLKHYGKLRGNSQAMLEFAWGKLYNSNVQMPCSKMPRYGHRGILTEQQMQDVMAFLFDLASPVNQ